jgi:TPR repeat protein
MGDAKACYALGFAYKGASDLLEDATKARKFMKLACELGSGSGCESVARMFASGYGGEQDEGFALAALDHGCDLKHAESCHMLGHRVIAPEVEKRNWTVAFDLFMQACDLGNEEACDDVKLIEEKTLGNSKSSKPANDSRRM